MTFKILINTVNQGDIETLTPYLLKQLGTQYLAVIKNHSKNYGYKHVAKALISFAEENPYASSEDCADQLIHSLTYFSSLHGVLADNILAILNRLLATNITTIHTHRSKSNLEVSDEFYHALLYTIKCNVLEQVRPGDITSINHDLIKYLGTKYLERAQKRPYFHLNASLAERLINFANNNSYASEKQCVEQLLKTFEMNKQLNHSWLNECIIAVLNQALDLTISLIEANYSVDSKSEVISKYQYKLKQMHHNKAVLAD
ncbi:hypothetical protein L3V82_05055 [Thiotrichales bacterium 19S3-7]|nr:hypothetical protein [Thiotrichales bacterium 19S3-7]MCF6801461.1 hypothetical protein [Thiotrichales bacterium 19S3-11]